MKSSCYVGAVTNAYRMAIDRYFEDPDGYKYDPAWLCELESVCHRQYCTGFFFGETVDNANVCETPGYIKEQAALAVCDGYDEESGRAYFTKKNKFSVGERIEILVPGKTAVPFTVDAIYGENGEPIESTPHPMMKFSVNVPIKATEFSIIRYARGN